MRKPRYYFNAELMYEELLDAGLQDEYIDCAYKESELQNKLFSKLGKNEKKIFDKILLYREQEGEIEHICMLRRGLKLGKIIFGRK